MSNTTAQPTTTAPTTTRAPPTLPPPSPAPDLLERGAEGPAVEDLQARLGQLGYWVGPIGGVFGTATEQAVYALQKVRGLEIDGIVGPADRRALGSPAPIPGHSGEGLIWEIDKSRQVVIVVRDGEVLWIWNTSTGTERPYTHRGTLSRSVNVLDDGRDRSAAGATLPGLGDRAPPCRGRELGDRPKCHLRQRSTS